MMNITKIAALSLALALVGITAASAAEGPARRTVTVANWDRAATDPLPLGAKCTVPADYIPAVEGPDGKDVLVKVDRDEQGVKGACSDKTLFFMPKKVFNDLVERADKRDIATAALGLRAVTVVAKKAAADQLAATIKAQQEAVVDAKQSAGTRKVK